MALTRTLLWGAALAALTSLAACDGHRDPVSLTITPDSSSVPAGVFSQISASVTYADGTVRDVTNEAAWTSGDGAILDARGRGKLLGVSPGHTTVSARWEGATSSAEVDVTEGVLARINAFPTTVSLPIGVVQQLSVTATYSDLVRRDVTAQASWTSANPALVRVVSPGKIEGLAVGATSVTVALAEFSVVVPVTVTSARLTGLSLTPEDATAAKGTTTQLRAMASYSDGTQLDVSEQATWSSSNPGTAQVLSDVGMRGKVVAVDVGSSQLAAQYQSLVAYATVVVTPPVVNAVQVTPVGPTALRGSTVQLTARAFLSDLTQKDVTATALWSAPATGVVTVSATGLVSAVGYGSAQVTATLDGKSGTTGVTVIQGALTRVDVTPASFSLANGKTRQLTATGVYEDGSLADLTSTATWGTADAALATVSTQGLVTAKGEGMVAVTATSGTKTGTSQLTVTQAELVSIAFTPASPNVTKGGTLQMLATGTYTDSSTKDVTALAAWSTDDPLVATVSPTGEVSGVELGTCSLKAQLGTVVQTATLAVTP